MDENLDQAILRWHGRFAVAVIWEDSTEDEADVSDGFAFSAFIMSVHGMWYLVTAGHVIDDINTRCRQGRRFRRAQLADMWSADAISRLAIPFPDLVTTPQGHIHDEDRGWDYAWFYLSDYYRRLLEANGIVPISEIAWKNLPNDLEGFSAYGFPANCVHKVLDKNGKYSAIRLRPAFMYYQKVIDPPEELIRQFERCYFEPPHNEDGTFVDVSGMSGGPIFGYRRVGNDTKVWLVAIQSAQANPPLPRFAIGCPAEIFGRAFEDAIEKEILRRNADCKTESGS